MFDRTVRGDVFVRPLLYDVRTGLCTLGGRARAYARAAGLLSVDAAERMLDVGTGTGAMAIALKRAHPHTEVHALEPGEQMLRRARTNGARAGVVVHFREGWAQDLPYAASEFDAVTLAAVLQHIPPGQRGPACAEVRRVLRPRAPVLVIEVDHPAVVRRLPLAQGLDVEGLDVEDCAAHLRWAGFTDVHTGRLRRSLLAFAIGVAPRPWSPGAPR